MDEPALTLHRLELALARRDRSMVERPLEELLHPAFAEVGMSGRRWDRASMIDLLRSSPRAETRIRDFAASALGADAMLVTYRTDVPRAAYRVSIWVRMPSGWQIRYHQGTPEGQPSAGGSSPGGAG